jgi:hypothetical protein
MIAIDSWCAFSKIRVKEVGKESVGVKNPKIRL